MNSRKLLNGDGSTKSIVLQKESGAFNSFTPREAAEAISELKAQLWNGKPFDNQFYEARKCGL